MPISRTLILKRNYLPTHLVIWRDDKRHLAQALCEVIDLIRLSRHGWPDGHTIKARFVDSGHTEDIGSGQILLITDHITARRLCAG